MEDLLATTLPLPERRSEAPTPSTVAGPSHVRPRFIRRTTSEGGQVQEEEEGEVVPVEPQLPPVTRPTLARTQVDARRTV